MYRGEERKIEGFWNISASILNENGELSVIGLMAQLTLLLTNTHVLGEYFLLPILMISLSSCFPF